MFNKIKFLRETKIPEYHGNIFVPKDWKDLSKLPKKYSGYVPGCKLIGNFNCIGSELASLEGGPVEIDGNFNCSRSVFLTSLKGSPVKVSGHFACRKCTNLTTLEGGPEKIGDVFDCSDCGALASLNGAPAEIGGDFYCSGCASLTSILGLLKIKKRPIIALYPPKLKNAIEIINKYDGLKDIIRCKVELIEAGLKEYAKL